MAMTESKMMPLGAAAPDFALPDANGGATATLAGLRGEKGMLVMFICNHCPFVVHICDELARLGRDYAKSGIGVAAISANDAEKYPDDHPSEMKKQAARCGFVFPYLYDETQETARAYGAMCTPDFFLFDAELKCAYRGRFDGSRPGGKPATGEDLRAAMDALLAGGAIPAEKQLPSIGCSIKWKS